MSPDAAALRADHVTKRFGPRLALDNVSVEVGAGECVALIGESGAGKTTLLRCFNRLVDPDQGRVLVGEIDVRELDPFVLRRRTGYVPQDGGLLPHWRAHRKLRLGARPCPPGKTREAAPAAPHLAGGGARPLSPPPP